MVKLFEAIEIILSNTLRLNTVTVPILDSYDLTLAENIISPHNIPPFTKSAMDGYAVRSADFNNPPVFLNVIDEIQAGRNSKHKIIADECIRIMTGAPVPQGADAVIRFEDTELMSKKRIKVLQTLKPHRNVIPEGDNARKGDVIIPRDTTLKGPEIAILASIGKGTVEVYRRPKIAVVSTGSELREYEEKLDIGTIRNSNGPMQQSLARSLPLEVAYLGLAHDEKQEITRYVTQYTEYDIFVISGGVSVGPYDLVPETLEECGAKILVDKVMVKPGKPFVFGKLKECLLFGLSGNPVSNFMAFYLYVKPAIYKMLGRSNFSPLLVEAQIDTDFHKKTNFYQIVPSRYILQEGKFKVSILPIHGSADIIGCSGCNCLTFIESRKHVVRSGDRIPILLLDY
jgi:molybdopterin molybdotransferase